MPDKEGIYRINKYSVHGTHKYTMQCELFTNHCKEDPEDICILSHMPVSSPKVEVFLNPSVTCKL
jgi:hypothetical protein